MKLLSLQLCNFRQFYGETPVIEIAGGAQKKVTIIHGNNGAGKTTLLNAFTWVLFGKFTTAFKAQDNLINKRALAEVAVSKPVECWGELAFEHSGRQYRVRRSRQGYRESNTVKEGKEDIRIYVAEEDGRWITPKQEPEDVINRLLPESLHQYFFFDGERIEKIVESNKKDEIAEATKTLIGLEVFDRSINHLKKAQKELRDRFKNIGDSETKEFIEKKEQLEKEIEKLEKEQEEVGKELEAQKILKDEVDKKYLELQGVSGKQKLRKQLEKREELEREQLKQAREAIKLEISTNGYAVLLKDATAKFHKLVDGLRERGELPSDIKRQFVQDLLERQRCICGLELCEGTENYSKVQAYLSRAGLADVEETVIRMGAQIEAIDAKVPKFREAITRQQSYIIRLKESLSKIETELDKIKEELSQYPDEDVQKTENRRTQIDKAIRDFTFKQGANNQKLKDLAQEIAQLDEQIRKHRMVESKQTLARNRVEAAGEAMKCLQKVRENFSTSFRAKLEKRIQKVFSQISITPYLPRLNEQYELKLEDLTTGQPSDVAASQGESQILSLSYIGAIVAEVRDWSEKKQVIGPEVNTFPLVMDSPFGALDENHRRQVAKSIPVLANQLVVLVSKTQWRNEVEEEMDELIGKMYVLSYHSPKKNVERDEIALNGERYPLVRQSVNEYEWTEIVEVS